MGGVCGALVVGGGQVGGTGACMARTRFERFSSDGKCTLSVMNRPIEVMRSFGDAILWVITHHDAR